MEAPPMEAPPMEAAAIEVARRRHDGWKPENMLKLVTMLPFFGDFLNCNLLPFFQSFAKAVQDYEAKDENKAIKNLKEKGYLLPDEKYFKDDIIKNIICITMCHLYKSDNMKYIIQSIQYFGKKINADGIIEDDPDGVEYEIASSFINDIILQHIMKSVFMIMNTEKYICDCEPIKLYIFRYSKRCIKCDSDIDNNEEEDAYSEATIISELEWLILDELIRPILNQYIIPKVNTMLPDDKKFIFLPVN
jgi:hypothetical protein